MCPCETGVRFRRAYGLVAILAAGLLPVRAVYAQASSDSAVAWHRIGGTAIQNGLASAATGPVRSVWFAPGNRALLVRTQSNRIFETTDFAHWRLNTTDSAPPSSAMTPVSRGRVYAAARDNVYGSEDNGKSWVNLTGYNGHSILGEGFTSLAVSPANPQEIAAANQFGIWRSLDGGMSWRGLNDDLPNLPARRLLSGRLVELADSTVIRFEAGAWVPANAADQEAGFRESIGRRSGWQFASVATAGGLVYGGTADGRLAVSRDGGATWSEAPRATSAGIDRIWADMTRPESALAASGTRFLRTVNGGLFWDDVTGALPQAAIHGIAADRSASVVYLATDRGVFAGTLSLNDAGPAASNWKSLGADLPAAPAWDVRLSADGKLTVALDGYGIFESVAPHRTRNVRVVNGADLSDRAAAPGSLISVLGANVREGIAGGATYPVLAASDQSSQLQVPFESSTGAMQLTIESADGRWTAPLNVKDASPAIFVDSDGAPLVLDSSTGLVIDPTNAVHAGSTVQVLATGLGKVTPDWPTGTPAPLDSPPEVRAPVSAYIDGSPARVIRATLAPGYVGYYLVELEIPAIVNQGVGELRLSVNGEESNRVRLSLDADRAAQ